MRRGGLEAPVLRHAGPHRLSGGSLAQCPGEPRRGRGSTARERTRRGTPAPRREGPSHGRAPSRYASEASIGVARSAPTTAPRPIVSRPPAPLRAHRRKGPETRARCAPTGPRSRCLAVGRESRAARAPRLDVGDELAAEAGRHAALDGARAGLCRTSSERLVEPLHRAAQPRHERPLLGAGRPRPRCARWAVASRGILGPRRPGPGEVSLCRKTRWRAPETDGRRPSGVKTPVLARACDLLTAAQLYR